MCYNGYSGRFRVSSSRKLAPQRTKTRELVVQMSSMKLTKNQLVEMILATDVTIGNLERQLKNIKKIQSDNESALTEIMEVEEIRSFKTEDGKTVNRQDKPYFTLRNDDKPAWFDWIDSIGRGDLIKTDVNKNSFNALLKKSIEEGTPLPDFFDLSKDVFFRPHIQIQSGRKSLRRSAEEAGADASEVTETRHDTGRGSGDDYF